MIKNKKFHMLFTNNLINLQDFFKSFGLHAFIEISLETMVIVLISTIITVSFITLRTGKFGKTLDIGAKVVGIVSGSIYIVKSASEGSQGSGSNSNPNDYQPDDGDKKILKIVVKTIITVKTTIQKILPMNQKVQINNRKYIHHSFSLPLILGMLDIDPTQLNTNFSHYAYGVFLLSLVALLCFINVLFYITIHYLIQVRNYELKYPKLNKIINLYKKVNILYIFIEALICFVCLILIVFFSLICIYTFN